MDPATHEHTLGSAGAFFSQHVIQDAAGGNWQRAGFDQACGFRCQTLELAGHGPAHVILAAAIGQTVGEEVEKMIAENSRADISKERLPGSIAEHKCKPGCSLLESHVVLTGFVRLSAFLAPRVSVAPPEEAGFLHLNRRFGVLSESHRTAAAPVMPEIWKAMRTSSGVVPGKSNTDSLPSGKPESMSALR